MGQTRYPSKKWVFKSRLSFKVRQHGQQLYLQYKVCWILYKMLTEFSSFSQPYLWIQPTLQSPSKNRSYTAVNIHLPIPPLLAHKIIFTIPTNIPFLYTSTIFCLPFSLHNHPNNLHQTCFPYPNYFANLGCVKELGS